MIKKGSVLLLVLLASLPGCGGRKDKKLTSKDYMAQSNRADDFNSVNLALADTNDELEVDESMRSFFGDMEQFVLGDDVTESDFELAEAESPLKSDEFAWLADEKQFEPVYFGFDKKDIDVSERQKIVNNAGKLKQLLDDACEENAKATLVIEGHACASAGSDPYNLALSEQRAKKISDLLVGAGISRDTIKTVGRGSEMRVVKEGNKEEQWPNRRVEFHVIYS